MREQRLKGDGIQIAWRELMGRERFTYAVLTEEIITARKALVLAPEKEGKVIRPRMDGGPAENEIK